MEKYKILKVKNGNFQSDEGEEIIYFWYKAQRLSDGVSIDFGSQKEYSVGDEIETTLEKKEVVRLNKKTGKSMTAFRYTEPSEA